MVLRILKTILISFFFIFFSKLTFAEEYLMFVGKLEKITLYPEEETDGSQKCYIEEETGNEVCSIYISNVCGTEVIDFGLLRGIYGTFENDQISLTNLIGEWCEPVARVYHDIEFVFVRIGEYADYIRTFNMITEKDEPVFKASQTDSALPLYAYIDDPEVITACQKITETDCKEMFVPVIYPIPLGMIELGDGEEFLVRKMDGYRPQWILYKDLNKMGIVSKNENNEVFLTKAFSLDAFSEVLRLKRLEEAGLR